MTEWRKVKLGDVVSIKSGLSYKSEYIGKGDNLLLGMGCVSYKEKFVESGARPYSQDCDPKYLAVPGDIVLATRQQSDNLPILAMPAIIPEKYSGRKIIIGTNLYKVENNSDIDNRFLYWVLKGKDYVNYIRGVKTGTTVQMVSKRNVEEYHFLCPPKSVRDRIVSILSRYDALIENYQRQIKLLEEAAQRLYKEWFVDLRFPGHQSTPIINNLPQGWQIGVLDDLAYESGKKIDKKNRDNYNCYLPIDCIPKHSLTYLEPASVSLAESSLVSFAEDDIIFGAMRPYFHKVCFAQSNGLTRTTCFVLNSRNRIYREYLLMLLFDDSTIKHATSISVGTTMPYTRWKEFKSMEVKIPSEDIAIKFGERISLIIKKLKISSTQIRNLSEARDRLLPKLMSAEIEV